MHCFRKSTVLSFILGGDSEKPNSVSKVRGLAWHTLGWWIMPDIVISCTTCHITAAYKWSIWIKMAQRCAVFIFFFLVQDSRNHVQKEYLFDHTILLRIGFGPVDNLHQVEQLFFV